MPFPSYESDCFNKLYPKQLKLTKVQLIHRHGERTPVSNDKPIWSQCAIIPHLSAFHDFVRTHPETLINFDNITFPGDLSTLEVSRQLPLYNSNGECMPGQLTDTGKHSMLTMGKNLRTLYSDQLNFFSAQNPRNLYLRSTGYVRTIESLQYLLTGMFPAGIPNVPLNILSNEHENMYPNGHNCYKLRELSKQFRKSQSELLKPLIDKVSAELSHFHPVKPDAISLGDLNDYYLCKSGNNVHHDPSFTKEIKRNLEEISVKTFWNQWQDDHQLARLSIGRFVNDLKEDQKNPGLSIFSGHDSTLAPLLGAFKVFDQRIPLFHSIVSVEYFKEDGFLKSDEYVRMNYNGNALKIPSCQIAGNNWKGDGQFCTKKEFMRIVDEIIPKDFETECK